MNVNRIEYAAQKSKNDLSDFAVFQPLALRVPGVFGEFPEYPSMADQSDFTDALPTG